MGLINQKYTAHQEFKQYAMLVVATLFALCVTFKEYWWCLLPLLCVFLIGFDYILLKKEDN